METLLENMLRTKKWLLEDLEAVDKRIKYLQEHPEVQEYFDITTKDGIRREKRAEEYEQKEKLAYSNVIEHIPTENLSSH